MFNHLPKGIQILLWLNGGLFLLQQLIDPAGTGFFTAFYLWPLGMNPAAFGLDALPSGVGFMPWQLLTYGFLHGGLAHIFFNMFALLMFGAPLEYTWGTQRFLTYYLICVVGAGLTYLGWAALMDISSPVLGASGGVFGLLLAYGMLFPRQRVMLLFPPIPMSARTLVIGYGALELLMGVTGIGGNIAHFAHLGGMLFGWLVIRYWRGQPPFRKRGRSFKI
ncbi:MAG: rhomboid family intramembrane serine protease [Proteobacteria bacterium]|nr:rhomboid family intramembrane serine protease [Pseudomonadota bacterium]